MNTRSLTQTKPSLSTPVQIGLLQRKCAQCDEKKELLQRQAVNQTNVSEVPAIVHEVLRSPGQPLDAATCAFMEPRFDHDFSQVRVHTDAKAKASAQAVNALAYTAKNNVVFDAERYAPETISGKQLLAHELTHVIQQQSGTGNTELQSKLGVSQQNDASEQEADAIAQQVVAGKPTSPIKAQSHLAMQRMVKVDKPVDKIPKPGGKGLDQTNATTVQSYLTTLCSGGSVVVGSTSGNISVDKTFCTEPPLPSGFVGPPTPAPASLSKEATGCSCLCDMTTSKNSWTIKVDDTKWPQTNFDDPLAALGKKAGGTGGSVTTPSPNSPKLWGAATVAGRALNIDPWLVLGHELCGHGWLGDRGLHAPDEASPRGEGGHQETVKRENELRKEHGIELRGTFKDPDCGESFWRDKSSPTAVNWSSFRTTCQDWRNDYNKKNGTSYKITDRIP